MNEIFSALAGGSALAALLTLLVRATLAMLRSQGQQMREWQQIIDAKDSQLAQKDRQIERLELIVGAQDKRLAERDERIRRLEIKVAELEREVLSD